MSFVGNPDQFRAHVAALPKLEDHDDPDEVPGWVRPTHEITGRQTVEYDAILQHAARGDVQAAPLQRVPVARIRQTQGQINLAAVRHYVDKPHELYDPDGWLGTEHPVVVQHPQHGPVIADGNSRFSAALIRGDTEIKAHVVHGVSKPAHVAALQEHSQQRAAATAEHGERLRALREQHGSVAGFGAPPDARAGVQESMRIMEAKHKELDAELQRRLSR